MRTVRRLPSISQFRSTLKWVDTGSIAVKCPVSLKQNLGLFFCGAFIVLEPHTQKSSFVVLSYIQTKLILSAKQNGQSSLLVSLDLGLTQAEIRLAPDFIHLPNGERLSWETIEEIA